MAKLNTSRHHKKDMNITEFGHEYKIATYVSMITKSKEYL